MNKVTKKNIFGAFLLAACAVSVVSAFSQSDNDTPWTMHSLEPSPASGSDGVKLADVNDDGFPDLVTGFEEDGVSRIYLNPGHDKVKREHWKYVELPSPHVEDALLVDLDGNGVIDLVTASEGAANQVLFHWAPDKPGDYLDASKWKTEAVPSVSGMSAWMFAISADMDKKNGPDLFIGSKRKNGETGDDKAVVGWLKCPENPRDISKWSFHPLTKAGWIMSVMTRDMNQDGRMDILISDRKNSTMNGVRWLENPGLSDPGFFGEWASHSIGKDVEEPMFLAIQDLNGDGLDDIVVPDLYKGLVFLEQKSGFSWEQRLVPYPDWAGSRGKSVAIADMDLDGLADVVLSFEEEGKVAGIPFREYEKAGAYSVIGASYGNDPFTGQWSFHKISDKKGRKFDLVNLIDLDGDGDLDVLTNDENEEDIGLGVIWYENPAKTGTGSQHGYEVSVQYPQIPLLKRQPPGQLACLKFFVDKQSPDNFAQSVDVMINTDAYQQFDHLLVYGNGGEPLFDTTAAHTIFVPVAGKFSIPVNIALKQGWNYIWLAASLKENADLDARPSVEILGISDKNKQKFPVVKTSGRPEKRIGITIRKAWDDNVHTYRIPGVVRSDKGTLISVYDNRYLSSKDLPGNVDVGMSRSTDGGKTWEPMKVIMDMGEPHGNNGIGDPAILFDPSTKTIWVAALWSKGNRSIAGSEPGLSPEVSGQLMLVSSRDDGKTWSAPHNITAEVKNPIWHIYFNGPGSGIVMQDGTLVFAAQYWDESKKPGIPHATIMYSKDHGKTWKSGTGFRRNTTESQVVETVPGTLMLNMRDQRGYFRAVATTTDLGKTWREHPTSWHALPDPICMASIIKGKVKVKGVKKDVLFFSNVNMSAVEHSRKNMTIKASLDLGESWLPAHQLLLDERYGYGYSTLTQIDDTTIGILYEGERDLHFLRVPVKDIIK